MYRSSSTILSLVKHWNLIFLVCVLVFNLLIVAHFKACLVRFGYSAKHEIEMNLYLLFAYDRSMYIQRYCRSKLFRISLLCDWR
uniref:Uncharacterized protein n=1 Tax=Arundo donax TaxID=35708 RepID=A0A0A8ZFL8_ARUDO